MEMVNRVGIHSINPSVIQILVSGDESICDSLKQKELLCSRFVIYVDFYNTHLTADDHHMYKLTQDSVHMLMSAPQTGPFTKQ